MALGGILGSALNPATAHPWTLTVQGLDVIRDPAGAYGSPLESWQLTQAAAGGVSSMTFAIEVPDSSTSVDVFIGDWVLLTYNPTSSNVFRGFVQTVKRAPMGPNGVTITVSAQGVETILDWSVLHSPYGSSSDPFPDFICVTGTDINGYVQHLLANYTIWGAPGVKVSVSASTSMVGAGLESAPATLQYDCRIPDGTSVRAALRILAEASSTPTTQVAFTIDPNMDLRGFLVTYGDNGRSTATTDIPTVTVQKAAGAIQASDISTELDGGAAVQQVLSVGAFLTTAAYFEYKNATGTPGPVTYVIVRDADANLSGPVATKARMDAALVNGRTKSRGTLTVETQSEGVYTANAQLVITDPVIPGASPAYFVAGDVDVQFYDTLVSYRYTFGASRPSYVDAVSA